jgi:penicillin-insensitive murein endopeptidase
MRPAADAVSNLEKRVTHFIPSLFFLFFLFHFRIESSLCPVTRRGGMPMYPRHILLAATLALAAIAGGVLAQEKGTLEPVPPPPLAHPEDPSTPAKQLFGRQVVPAALAARTIGFYSHGCLAGGEALPVNGSAWQVMRLSRNRNWGHPALLAFLERFARKVPAVSHWPGILVGDMSQPRGGPMLTGHASHQIGLDADIWLTPMPNRELSRLEREEMSAANMVRSDRLDVDPAKWTPDHLAVIQTAAQDPDVQRIFVNAAIKKALCRDARGDRSWLNKVRPYYGHDYHFHIRLACPAGEDACRDQDPVPPGDGCDASLAWWFSEAVLHPKPGPEKPKPPLTMAQLPPECKQVLTAR